MQKRQDTYEYVDDFQYYDDENYNSLSANLISTSLNKSQSICPKLDCDIISQLETDLKSIADNTGTAIGFAFYFYLKNNLDKTKSEQEIFDTNSYVEDNTKEAIDSSMCPSCFCPVEPTDIERLECLHFLCKDCFKGFIEAAIKEGSSCVLLKCPQEGCKLYLGPFRISKKKFMIRKNFQ
jgi:hypothetical protein